MYINRKEAEAVAVAAEPKPLVVKNKSEEQKNAITGKNLQLQKIQGEFLEAEKKQRDKEEAAKADLAATAAAKATELTKKREGMKTQLLNSGPFRDILDKLPRNKQVLKMYVDSKKLGDEKIIELGNTWLKNVQGARLYCIDEKAKLKSKLNNLNTNNKKQDIFKKIENYNNYLKQMDEDEEKLRHIIDARAEQFQRDNVKRNNERVNRAATTVQRATRNFLKRQKLKKEEKAAETIQRAFRGSQVRKNAAKRDKEGQDGGYDFHSRLSRTNKDKNKRAKKLKHKENKKTHKRKINYNKKTKKSYHFIDKKKRSKHHQRRQLVKHLDKKSKKIYL